MSSPVFLEQGQSVEIRRGRDGTVLTCEVRYCNALEAGDFHLGLRILAVPSDRRKETRYAVNETATLSWAAGADRKRMGVMVRDISKSGIGLTIASHLSHATKVEITSATSLITATVQYCRPLGDGTYLCGCRITDARPAILN